MTVRLSQVWLPMPAVSPGSGWSSHTLGTHWILNSEVSIFRLPWHRMYRTGLDLSGSSNPGPHWYLNSVPGIR